MNTLMRTTGALALAGAIGLGGVATQVTASSPESPDRAVAERFGGADRGTVGVAVDGPPGLVGSGAVPTPAVGFAARPAVLDDLFDEFFKWWRRTVRADARGIVRQRFDSFRQWWHDAGEPVVSRRRPEPLFDDFLRRWRSGAPAVSDDLSSRAAREFVFESLCQLTLETTLDAVLDDGSTVHDSSLVLAPNRYEAAYTIRLFTGPSAVPYSLASDIAELVIDEARDAAIEALTGSAPRRPPWEDPVDHAAGRAIDAICSTD